MVKKPYSRFPVINRFLGLHRRVETILVIINYGTYRKNKAPIVQNDWIE